MNAGWALDEGAWIEKAVTWGRGPDRTCAVPDRLTWPVMGALTDPPWVLRWSQPGRTRRVRCRCWTRTGRRECLESCRGVESARAVRGVPLSMLDLGPSEV